MKMKDLLERIIEEHIEAEYCPHEFDLEDWYEDSCNGHSCNECWKQALERLEDYPKFPNEWRI